MFLLSLFDVSKTWFARLGLQDLVRKTCCLTIPHLFAIPKFPSPFNSPLYYLPPYPSSAYILYTVPVSSILYCSHPTPTTDSHRDVGDILCDDIDCPSNSLLSVFHQHATADIPDCFHRIGFKTTSPP